MIALSACYEPAPPCMLEGSLTGGELVVSNTDTVGGEDGTSMSAWGPSISLPHRMRRRGVIAPCPLRAISYGGSLSGGVVSCSDPFFVAFDNGPSEADFESGIKALTAVPDPAAVWLFGSGCWG